MCYHGTGADGDRSLVQHGEVEICEEAFSNANLLAVVAEKGLVDNNLFIANAAQKVFEDAQALFLQRRRQGIIPMDKFAGICQFSQEVSVIGRIDLPASILSFSLISRRVAARRGLSTCTR